MRRALCLLLLAAQAAAAPPAALTRAYAHNDYRHGRPLHDALERGFMGVEADVHLRGRELLIGHSGGETRPGVTLQKLYLDPLLERVRRNGGRVHPGGPGGFLLMVEFKSDGEESYPVLREILQGYRSMLTSFTADRIKEGAVTVVITGRRPSAMLAAEDLRYAGIDGDLGDLGKPEKTLYPTISDDWGSNFQWRRGRLSNEERARLAGLVARAHAKGRKIRFWGIPDREDAWALMYAAGVDHINTDDLDGLRAFLLRRVARLGPESLPRLRRSLSSLSSLSWAAPRSTLPLIFD